MAEVSAEVVDTSTGKDLEYCDSLDNVLRINIALRNLQLAGQILRNFAGSLKAPQKAEIARAAFSLGLRTLGAVYTLSEANRGDVKQYLAAVIRGSRARLAGLQHQIESDERELAKETEEHLIGLMGACAIGMLRRISVATGREILAETFRDVLDGSVPSRMIDTVIKLDHFAEFPLHEVERLHDDLVKNPFTSGVLRQLVFVRLYLFSVPGRIRQKLVERFDFKDGPRLLQNPQKTKRQ